jgi:hypothetical protein
MDSGICPVKQERLIKIEAKVYTGLHPTCQRATRKVQFGDVAQISNVSWQGEAIIVAQVNPEGVGQ